MSTRLVAGAACWSSLCALVVVGNLTGCPGTLEDPGRFQDASPNRVDATVEAGIDAGADAGEDGGCPDVVSTVFTPRCATPVCHSTASASLSGSLDLQAPNIYQRLVGKAASGGPGVLIDPSGDPNKSVLYLKLTPSPPFGSRMPLVGAVLDATTLACVASWIMSGAEPADGGVGDGAPEDSSSADTSPAEDTSPPALDSSTPDTGTHDSSVPDSTTPDSGGADGTVDAGDGATVSDSD